MDGDNEKAGKLGSKTAMGKKKKKKKDKIIIMHEKN